MVWLSGPSDGCSPARVVSCSGSLSGLLPGQSQTELAVACCSSGYQIRSIAPAPTRAGSLWQQPAAMWVVQDTNSASLPTSVRAAREAIDMLLVNSGSQARSSPLPPVHTPAHPPNRASHSQPHPQQQQQQPQQQQPAPTFKRGPGRPPKLKVALRTCLCPTGCFSV